MTIFTPHQDSALKAVADWLKAKPGKNGTPPVFRLFGYAGTGKTTLARHIADGVNGEVKFAAFTGKAALVMRNKGCDNASTIHSLIYRAKESGVEQPSFELWDDAPASKAKLIVIDECSMVDAELGRDLMSFDCPLLVLGDPAQLPRPWEEGDELKLYQNALTQLETADRLGYDHAWVVEHHFLEEYSHSPAPESFLAAASQRTTNIRLGHGIFQLTTNHPARVAERVAVLDLLSNGRMLFYPLTSDVVLNPC